MNNSQRQIIPANSGVFKLYGHFLLRFLQTRLKRKSDLYAYKVYDHVLKSCCHIYIEDLFTSNVTLDNCFVAS